MYKLTLKKMWKHFNIIVKHKIYVFYFCCRAGIPIRGLKHDLSKFSPFEFFEYSKYYSGDDSPVNNCKRENGYCISWLHHRGHNKHHWEYWIDTTDVNNPKGLLIPYGDCLEMICDYLGAGKAYNPDRWSFYSEYQWWESHVDHMILHPVVRCFLESIFGLLCEEEDYSILKKDFTKQMYNIFIELYEEDMKQQEKIND